ncbi:MAG: hypothetical protein Q7S21_01875 [archaeon]|nr:hypothetical protein [archaeon]
MFGLLSKKDPICGMKEQKGKGVSKNGEWFCSDHCAQAFEKGEKSSSCDCCH